ncbi:MAG: ABC transporter permease [Defluviitaleaceae bacterium]|nr:ABC transporter permease [Defluviitaleaceae bacterium]
MTIFKYALLRNLRSPVAYFAGLLVPSIFIIAPATMWTDAPAGGLLMLATLMLLSANLLAALILEDRMDGAVMKILISPTTMTRYIFQNLLASILPLTLQIILLGTLGLTRYHWSLPFTAGITITLLAFAMASAAFAFCWNTYFKSRGNSNYAFLFFIAVMMLISGLMVPTAALPTAIQHIGAIFYAYWFVRAVTALADYGTTAWFWLYNGIVLLFGTGFLLLGGSRRKL